MSNPPFPKILRLNDVKEITALPTSTIYRLIAQGKFPKQIKLSAHSVGWPESDVLQWINERIEQSRLSA